MSSELPAAGPENVGQPRTDLEPIKRLLLSGGVEQAEQLCRQPIVPRRITCWGWRS